MKTRKRIAAAYVPLYLNWHFDFRYLWMHCTHQNTQWEFVIIRSHYNKNVW